MTKQIQIYLGWAAAEENKAKKVKRRWTRGRMKRRTRALMNKRARASRLFAYSFNPFPDLHLVLLFWSITLVFSKKIYLEKRKFKEEKIEIFDLNYF